MRTVDWTQLFSLADIRYVSSSPSATSYLVVSPAVKRKEEHAVGLYMYSHSHPHFQDTLVLFFTSFNPSSPLSLSPTSDTFAAFTHFNMWIVPTFQNFFALVSCFLI
jgi:hypothetical protein